MQANYSPFSHVNFRLHRRLYAAPIYVPCVQFCNGERGKAAKNVGFTGSFPIAKLDTRHINRGPRKDVCEAENSVIRFLFAHRRIIIWIVPSGSWTDVTKVVLLFVISNKKIHGHNSVIIDSIRSFFTKVHNVCLGNFWKREGGRVEGERGGGRGPRDLDRT